MGKKYAIWNSNVNGFKFDFDGFNELEKELNARAKNIFLATINSMAHHQVSSCRTPKDIWDHLSAAHEGTSQVRETQVGILVNDFELFTQKKDKKIREISGHFNALINALKIWVRTIQPWKKKEVLECIISQVENQGYCHWRGEELEYYSTSWDSWLNHHVWDEWSTKKPTSWKERKVSYPTSRGNFIRWW